MHRGSNIRPVDFYISGQELPRVSGSVRDALETIVNKNSGSHFICEHTVEELTALCPKTRVPDFYRLLVEYFPTSSLIELKSLKLYCDKFRQREIFHEELLNEVFRDFEEVVKPRWLRLTLEVNVRGGIRTVVTRESGPKGLLHPSRVRGRSAE